MDAFLMVTGSKSLRLTWTDQPGVSQYKVYRAITNAQPGSPLATVLPGAQVYNDHGDGIPPAGLAPATPYWYWIADQNGALLAGPLTATTRAAVVKGPLYKDIQDALQAWVVGVTGFDPLAVNWADGSQPQGPTPFAVLDAWGPNTGSLTASQESMGEALGTMETWTVSVGVYTKVMDASGTITDAMQYARDLRASQDDPTVFEVLNSAGVGIGDRQAIQNLSAALETGYRRKAVFDFDINVRNVYPVSGQGVIETVTPISSTVTP